MDVRQVRASETRALRQQILRPHQTLDDLAREDDDRPDAVFFAAIEHGAVIGSASVRREAPPWAVGLGPAWRLRGVATDETRRRQRVGTTVLEAVVDYVRACGGGLLWCNARTTAVAFYQRAGFTTRGAGWNEPIRGPHVAMLRHIDSTP